MYYRYHTMVSLCEQASSDEQFMKNKFPLNALTIPFCSMEKMHNLLYRLFNPMHKIVIYHGT